MSDAVKLLADLVAIPSVNPGDRAVSGPGYTEREVVNYLEAFLRRAGIDCERQEVLPERENLIAVVEGRDASRTLFLQSHTDTVEVEGMTIEPFQPVIRDGKLYGRGACDAKGQVAAMLTALVHVVRRGRPPTNVAVIAGCEEEYRFRGVLKLLESGFRATAGVVGEPTELNLVIAHKGTVRWYLRTRGVTAHSSNPHLGQNAIYRMARIIAALERYAEALQARPAHPLVGPPTLSVTMISGGRQINVVPDECQITLDRRMIPGEDFAGVFADLRQFLRTQVDVEPEWETIIEDWSMEIPRDEPIVQRLEGILRDVTGHPPQVGGVAYGTDASKFVRAGIPTVVFGAGSIRQAHTAAEYLELDQLEQAVEVHTRLLQGGI